MRLYIAEKPSLARIIAKGLGVEKNEKGFIRCKNDAIVVCAFGHLLKLKDPDFYLPDDIPSKEGTKIWRLQDLPIIPKNWEKEPISGKEEQLNIIKKLLKEAKDVVVCGDADREGQNLVEEIIEYFNCDKPLLRFWSQSTDDISVSRALKDLQDNSKYHPLGVAAESRSRADWLIGINFTRALTCNNPATGLLSVGRVQTPLLKIIADRDNAIKNFKPHDFYGIDAVFEANIGTYTGRWQIPEDLLNADGYLTDLKKTEEILNGLKDQKGTVKAYEQKLKHQTPPIPFDLNELQKVCGKKFGFTPKKTLEIAQSLYEEHQLTSYPRSSCGYLSENQKVDVEPILKNLALTFPKFKDALEKTDPNRKSPIWDQKKVEESSHTGIIPTLRAITEEELNKLSEECRNVYELIAKRYIACFLEDYTYYETVAVTEVKENKFKSIGKHVVNNGFKNFLNDQKEEEDEKDNELPSLKKGDEVKLAESKLTKSVTKAPPAFTLVSIVDAMTNCYKYVDDPEEKKLLKEGKGIGTVATRAAILEILEKRGYMSVKGKKQEIHITDKGQFLLDAAPDKVKSVSLTAEAEEIMQRIQNNEGSIEVFIKQQESFIREQISEIQKIREANMERCPVCGQEIRRYKSKFNDQFYWRCTNKDCNKAFEDNNGKIGAEIIKKSVQKFTCPECRKEAVLHLESKKKPGNFYFWCTECKATFKDNEGKIGEKMDFSKSSDNFKKVKCPSCGKKTCGCYQNKSGNGQHWYCSECKDSFSDSNGKPGKKFVK